MIGGKKGHLIFWLVAGLIGAFVFTAPDEQGMLVVKILIFGAVGLLALIMIFFASWQMWAWLVFMVIGFYGTHLVIHGNPTGWLLMIAYIPCWIFGKKTSTKDIIIFEWDSKPKKNEPLPPSREELEQRAAEAEAKLQEAEAKLKEKKHDPLGIL